MAARPVWLSAETVAATTERPPPKRGEVATCLIPALPPRRATSDSANEPPREKYTTSTPPSPGKPSCQNRGEWQRQTNTAAPGIASAVSDGGVLSAGKATAPVSAPPGRDCWQSSVASRTRSPIATRHEAQATGGRSRRRRRVEFLKGLCFPQIPPVGTRQGEHQRENGSRRRNVGTTIAGPARPAARPAHETARVAPNLPPHNLRPLAHLPRRHDSCRPSPYYLSRTRRNNQLSPPTQHSAMPREEYLPARTTHLPLSLLGDACGHFSHHERARPPRHHCWACQARSTTVAASRDASNGSKTWSRAQNYAINMIYW